MTLRFIDGANGYTAAQAAAGRKWGFYNANSIEATAGRRSSPCHRMTNWTQRMAFVDFANNQSTFITGFAFKVAALPTGASKLVTRASSNLGVECSLCLKTDGTLEVRRGADTGTILGTSTAVITPSTYCYLEVKFIIHTVSGSVIVKKDGVDIINLTGINTSLGGISYANGVGFSLATNPSEAATIDWDDIYICDGSGSTNNNFLGDLRVDAVFPNGAGNSSAFTPSAGSNWQNVDEDPADDDVTYNTANAAGAIDLYAFPDIAPTVGTVFGVVSYLTMKKDDSDIHTAMAVIRRSAANYPSTHKTLTTSYAMYQEVHETDPSTLAQWTIANVNAAEFGLELVS